MDKKELKDGIYAFIKTNKGEIIVSLEYEKAPMTCCNFIGLATGVLNQVKPGKPFYDGLTFHRVVPDFMIQGGCPKGNGTGNPGYRFPDEFTSLKHDREGTLSMANSGPGTNGSQFFITHVPTPWLDGHHSVFGYVIDGQDVVNKIEQGDKIESIKIERVGEKAKTFEVSETNFSSLIVSQQKRDAAKKREKREKINKEVLNRYPKAKLTSSGIWINKEREGDGKNFPHLGDTVKVDYQGEFFDGRIFDSSYLRKEPAFFNLGEVIDGWNIALQLMSKGEKSILVIPPELAYGEMGIQGIIPGDETLIFTVELLDFTRNKKK